MSGADGDISGEGEGAMVGDEDENLFLGLRGRLGLLAYFFVV